MVMGKVVKGTVMKRTTVHQRKLARVREKGKNTELQPENIDIKIKAEVLSAEDVEPEKGERGKTEKCGISGKHDERDVSEKHDEKKRMKAVMK